MVSCDFVCLKQFSMVGNYYRACAVDFGCSCTCFSSTRCNNDVKSWEQVAAQNWFLGWIKLCKKWEETSSMCCTRMLSKLQVMLVVMLCSAQGLCVALIFSSQHDESNGWLLVAGLCKEACREQHSANISPAYHKSVCSKEEKLFLKNHQLKM